MAINTSNVIVGAATLYTAPANTALPADSVVYGGAWPAGWTDVGATEEGVSQIVGTDTSDINIEEQATPVSVMVTRRNVRVQVALAEDVLENIKLAWGGGTLTTVVGPPATKTLVLSDTLATFAIAFEALNSYGFFRRFYVPVVMSTADVTTRYRRAAAERSYAVEFRAICASNQILLRDRVS